MNRVLLHGAKIDCEGVILIGNLHKKWTNVCSLLVTKKDK